MSDNLIRSSDTFVENLILLGDVELTLTGLEYTWKCTNILMVFASIEYLSNEDPVLFFS